ncbi:MAG: translocation/assembly module TamB domain-containing protein [Gammaproteobacteria bacterium]
MRNSLLVAVFLVTTGLAVILGTSSGFRLLVSTANSFSDISIRVEEASGSLARGLTLKALRIETAASTIGIEDTELDMAILPLLYGRLDIARLHLAGVSVAQTDTPPAPATAESASLPVTIAIKDFRLTRLTFTDKENRQYRLDDLGTAIEADDTLVRFSGLNLFADNIAVHGDGRIHYQPRLSINASLAWSLEEAGTLPVVSGNTRIHGDEDKLETVTEFEQPVSGTLNATVMDLLNEPHWRADLETQPFNPRGLDDRAPDLRAAVSLQAAGTFAELDLNGKLLLRDIVIPDMDIRGGNGDAPVTIGFALNGRRGDDQYSAAGEINWQTLSVNLHSRQQTFTLPSGRLDLRLEDERLQLDTESQYSINEEEGRLQLSASAGMESINLKRLDLHFGEANLHVEGIIDDYLDTAALELASHWRNLSMPLNKEHSLRSPQGQLEIKGRLDDYNLNATGELRSTQLPGMSVRLDANGDRGRLDLQPLALSLLDGTATATGTIDWKETIRIDLDWQGKGINPGTYWPDWPGELELAGRTVITRQDDDFRFILNPLNVQGRLRQQPFSLELDSELADGTVTLKRARLGSGNAFLEAAGELSRESSDLRWQVNVPDLGALIPKGAGQVRGRGVYAGDPVQPVITANLTAADIQSPWLDAGSLNTILDIDLKDSGRLDIETDISEIAFGDWRLQELRLRVKGTGSAHEYRLNAVNKAARLNLNGEGTYSDRQWRGRTRDLTLTLADYGTWQLQEPAVTRIGRDRLGTESFCLRREPAHVCIQGAWQDAGHWNTRMSAGDLPLSLGKHWLPAYLDVDGAFNLELAMNVESGKAAGDGSLSLTPGYVDFRIDEEETQRFQVNGGEAELTLAGGKLTGRARLDLADLAEPISANLLLSGLEQPWTADYSQVDLQGGLSGRVEDLAFIASITPYITDSRGKLNIDLQAAGTLDKPELSGEFQLYDAGFHVPDLGVAIQDMKIQGNTSETGRYRFNGQWSSGGGTARIDAALEETEEGGLAIQADLSGDNTEIINLPEIQASASPQLRLNYSPKKRSVSGDVLITSALIDLDEMTTKTPVSDDVILVNGETPVEAAPPVPLRTDLAIRFGDDLRIQGQGITGNPGGRLDITNNSKGEVIATGEVNIRNGKFSAYGQSLTIEEGRLIYQQSRLDNPEVRIRAVRQVDDITAGVRVIGYLANPTVTLFSTPSMNQEEILSYIVFGRPLTSLSTGEGTDLIGAATSMGLRNSGFITNSLANTFGLDEMKVQTEPGTGVENASLIIGKYLTPRLYLSYGIGLFETINTVRIRYDITRRWAVEAQQGTEVGADLLYKFEK